ncbi:MAG: hypothetical protein R3F11_01505 [Verrucomicrobiales bacterium]
MASDPPSDRPRILILTAGFGQGHNTAARNLAEALLVESEGNADPVVVDLFDRALPRSGAAAKALYHWGISHLPGVWKRFYQMSDKMNPSANRADWFWGMTKALAKEVLAHPPAAIVSTYPLYPHLIPRLFDEGEDAPFPVITAITDSVSINSVWVSAPSSGYIVTDSLTRDHLLERRIDPESIRVLGFPVSLQFAASAGEGDAGPVSGGRRLLYFATTRRAHVRRTLASLLPVVGQLRIALTIVMGQSGKRLAKVVDQAAKAFPDAQIRLIGWTNAVPELLRSHHAVITKAGGAITHEALAAGCPPIINYIVPGQEEGNADLVVGHACGLRAPNPDDMGRLVYDLFAGDAEELEAMRRNAKQVGRPRAALDAARYILREIGDA